MPIAISAVAQIAGRTPGAWAARTPLRNGPREDAAVNTDAVDGRPPANLPRRRLTPQQAERQRPARYPDAIEDAPGDDERRRSTIVAGPHHESHNDQ